MNGNDQLIRDDLLPECVKILVSECHNLGETLMRQTLRRFSVSEGTKPGEEPKTKGGLLIEF